MQTKLVRLGSLLIFSIAIIYGLYKNSKKINQLSNGFRRVLKLEKPKLLKTLDIKYNSYYIAGFTSTHIYFGNYTAPGHILVTNYSLTDTHYIKLKIDTSKVFWKALKAEIDSPYIYLTEGVTPSMLRVSMPSLNVETVSLNPTTFNAIFRISPSSNILRAIQNNPHKNILIKETDNSPLTYSRDALQPQQDGVFSTDGTMNFDHVTSQIIYVYNYRNQFLCLDTNLNLLYRSKTIDTVSQANIKVSGISSDNVITMSKPPLIVNKSSFVSNNFLFINSQLMADNDIVNFFKSSSTIDVYSMILKKYLYSFYLRDYDGLKIKDFIVSEKQLIATSGNNILVYKLEF